MNTGPGAGADSQQELEQAALGPRKNRKATANVLKAKERSEGSERSEHSERLEIKRPRERKKSAAAASIPPWAAELWDWGRTLAIAVLVVFGLHYFVFSLSTVEGHSMQPTLNEKEWLFINKISYSIGVPKVGDIVILKDPSKGLDHKDFLVKRIVAEPGERIEVRQGELYRNGELVLEPYTDVLIEDDDYGPQTVTAGHYFVMGDNRHAGASRDSRSFQAVPRSAIVGRADLILWPITRWKNL